MTVHSKQLYKPCVPIDLESDRIIRIDGEPAQLPVRILQNLWPEQCLVFEAEGLPSNAPIRSDAFCIEMENHTLPIDVLVKSFKVPPIYSTLVMQRQPYEDDWSPSVSNVRLQFASFIVINLPRFFGRGSQFVEKGDVLQLRGSAVIETDPWRISLDETRNIEDVMHFFKNQHGGRAVTHTGELVRADGGSFGVEEALAAALRLRILLSFAAGRQCGIGDVVGRTTQGDSHRILWGASHAEPWNDQAHRCFPGDTGFDMVADLGPEVFALDEVALSTVRRAVDWYVQSNVAPTHVGVLVTQAALEVLSSHVGSGRNITEQIRDALAKCRISTTLPGGWPVTRGWDGPEALVKIRNDFAHARQKYGSSLPEQNRAWHLGQWYAEMMLLSILGCQGEYRNRLAEAGEDPIQKVPWVK